MTTTRQEIVTMLTQLSDRDPDWRFGQMAANVSFWAKGPTVEAMWDVEDEEFLAAITKHLSGKSQE